ncbi:MAG: antitoxin component YwqK of YwqJK toxin-antitoxin module [Verrucomicrobiales bacterium]|jgi:antitoxin component YwqK of YwqJK toxin-antitoxin module
MYELKISWILFGTALLAVGWGIWLKVNESKDLEMSDGKPQWVRVDGKLIERHSLEPYQGKHEVPFRKAPSMIQWEFTYVDGVRHGAAFEFFPGPNKKVKSSFQFVDGVRHGQVTTYQLNGIIHSEANAVDGLIQGLAATYNQDGTVLSRQVFVDSFPSGSNAIVAEPELVRAEVEEGEVDPEDPEYDPEAESEVFWLDDKSQPFTGMQVGTFYGGGKAFEHSYKDGREHGDHHAWDPAGQAEYERAFREGKKHGTWKHWATGGALISELSFQHGRAVGPARWWHPKGEQLREERNYVHGAEHGARVLYNTKGREIRRLTFDHGIQVGMSEAGGAGAKTPLPDGKKLTFEAGGESSEKIDFDDLPEGFAGFIAVKLRYRLSTDEEEPLADASRAFRVNLLVDGEIGEFEAFVGELDGWQRYEGRAKVPPGSTAAIQIQVVSGDLTIDFEGIRLGGNE